MRRAFATAFLVIAAMLAPVQTSAAQPGAPVEDEALRHCTPHYSGLSQKTDRFFRTSLSVNKMVLDSLRNWKHCDGRW